MAARACVGKAEMGIDFDPTLVAQVVGEDFGLLEGEACLPKVNLGGISPSSTYRGRAEPDASNDWGCGRQFCEPRPFLDCFL
jgi:hypothetical protein